MSRWWRNRTPRRPSWWRMAVRCRSGPRAAYRQPPGIAILATSDTGRRTGLTVDMDLDGRQVGQVISDNWIINDGGGTYDHD